ncbi:hypothetical protein DLM20_24380, partial [Salmonella enterica subsp. enterica serovar Java]|nr:hypothetical protein [Salmonella enterica subsp. enterica serovar Java]
IAGTSLDIRCVWTLPLHHHSGIFHPRAAPHFERAVWMALAEAIEGSAGNIGGFRPSGNIFDVAFGVELIDTCARGVQVEVPLIHDVMNRNKILATSRDNRDGRAPTRQQPKPMLGIVAG